LGRLVRRLLVKGKKIRYVMELVRIKRKNNAFFIPLLIFLGYNIEVSYMEPICFPIG